MSYGEQGLEEILSEVQNTIPGADVRVVMCDVSHELSLVLSLRAIRSLGNGWEVCGVFHCAGVIRDKLIRGGGALQGYEEVWASKAHSAYLLDRHTSSDSLQSFFCFSSITAATGTIGQSIYGAANAYLDGLMGYRKSIGLEGVSVRWPAIRQLGMAAASNLDHLWDVIASEALTLSPTQFERLLERLFVQSKCLNAVITIIQSHLLGYLRSHRIWSQVKNLQNQVDNEAFAPHTYVLTAHTRRSETDIASSVRSHLSDLIGNEAVTEAGPLMDGGLDSLGATELARRLSKEFGISLQPSLVFNYPTIKEITRYLSSLYEGRLETVSKVIPHSIRKHSAGDMLIAIIGMASRFPGGVHNLPSLWDVLVKKQDLTGEVSLSRWDSDAVIAHTEHSDRKVLDRIRYGACLTDEVLESFDANLFGISEGEASHMDPGQRLALEVAHEALIDAVYSMESLCGMDMGVFVAMSGFITPNISHALVESSAESSVYDATGATLSVTAGRISYVYGVNGPCSSIDTACSSSLVALHTARRSLQQHECTVALVVGVNVLAVSSSISCAMAGMISPDGKCHTFDDAANGYCRGEGCGAVVLVPVNEHPLTQQPSYGVILGSAVRQDGKRASLTAPNGLAQEHLHRAVLQDANIQPSEVRHIEAHGTGTSLGDPIEVGALVSVYGSRSGRGRDDPLSVSSVKANMGHLEAAAGMAGLFSAVLALYHGMAPPNAQLRLLNSKIVPIVREEPIAFAVEGVRLKRLSNKPLVAGVSSFGYSGTIASVILQEPPASSRREVLDRLKFLKTDAGSSHKHVWQYAGQGRLHVDVYRDLYDTEPSFREALMSCDAVMSDLIHISATDLLYPGISGRYTSPEAMELLQQTRYAQPVLVSLEYSLSKMWLDRGQRPWEVVGHSLGEYVAALVAEVMTMEECLYLVCERGRLMHERVECLGKMVAVRVTESEVVAAIESLGVSSEALVAAINGSESVVVSGSEEAVDKIIAGLGGVSHRDLGVRCAFHSPLMSCMLDDYRDVFSCVQLKPPVIMMVSTVLGYELDTEVTEVGYWLKQIVCPVQYSQAIERTLELGACAYIEMGADETLTRLSKSILSSLGGRQVKCVQGASRSYDMSVLGPKRKRHVVGQQSHRMLQKTVNEELSRKTIFVTRIHSGLLDEWVGDHVLYGKIIVPGAAWMEMMQSAGQRWVSGQIMRSRVSLRDVIFHAPLDVVDTRLYVDSSPTRVLCAISESGDIEILSDEGTVHATSALDYESDVDWSTLVFSDGMTGGVHASHAEIYSLFSSLGMDYGASFRLIEDSWSSEDGSEIVAFLSTGKILHHTSYTLPPPLLDAMLQSSISTASPRTQVPFGVDRVCIRSDEEALKELFASDYCIANVSIRSRSDAMTVFDCAMFTTSGKAVMKGDGVRVRAMSEAALRPSSTTLELVSNWVAGDAPSQAVSSIAQIRSCLLVGEEEELCKLVKNSLLSTSSKRIPHDATIDILVMTSAARDIDNERIRHGYDVAVILPNVIRHRPVFHWLHLLQLVLSASMRVIIANYVTAKNPDFEPHIASLAGLIRCALLEYRKNEISVVNINVKDLNLEKNFRIVAETMSGAIIRELEEPYVELEIYYKDDRRLVRRYEELEEWRGPWELHLSDRGSLDNMTLRKQVDRPDLQRCQVEVEVHAVSLNFRDILNCLGMYPGDPGSPGCECAGVVSRVGPGVESVSVGEEVICMGAGMLKSYVVCEEMLMHKKPASLTMEEAATVPIVYSTVQLGLCEMAGLCAGETVLIHAAGGGVGLTAIQYALRVGARVLATANITKHDTLRSLGVHMISTSRDASVFVKESQELLGERGKVDVVLNCLSGDYIPYSLDLLATGGRFIEIGKRGIWSAEEVQGKRPDVKYYVLELDTLSQTHPEAFHQLLSRVCEGFDDGVWKPIQMTVFDLRNEYRYALDVLRLGSNLGKVVLSNSIRAKSASMYCAERLRARALFGTYIISGGLGGLGLLTAQVLVRLGGIKSLVLLSRSGRVSYEDQGLEDRLRWLLDNVSGVEVSVMMCDVSDELSLSLSLRAVRRAGGSIVGIIHSAGVLHDALIRGGGAYRGADLVWSSKAISALRLHSHALCDEIDVFMCYSSITAAIGNIGQSSYGAANAYVDGMMTRRVSQGLPGVSIRWPAVSGIGMAAATVLKRGADTAGKDMTMRPSECEGLLEKVLFEVSRTSFPPVITICPVAMLRSIASYRVWTQFLGVADNNAQKEPSRAIRIRSDSASLKSSTKTIRFPDVFALVRKVVSSLTGTTSVTEDGALLDHGIDSLGATELAGRLSNELGVRLSPTLVFNYPSVREITNHISNLLGDNHENDVTASHEKILPLTPTQISIVGMACRLPKNTNTLTSLWDVLVKKQDLTGEVSLSRWDSDAVIAHTEHSDRKVLDRIRYGACLTDEVLESFDANLFGISEGEASHMDPGQRLALEVAHEALIDAGYSMESLRGMDMGVFVAVSGSMVSKAQMAMTSPELSVYDATGAAISVTAGRISYVYGVDGPCSSIDTACSSSLVAFHNARRSLQQHECTVALVVGVNVLAVSSSISCAMAGMISPDGKCHTFDDAANGYCRGEGCGAVVLVPVNMNSSNQQPSYGVILGSAVRQDGKRASLTAPNGLAQEHLHRAALQDANIQPSEVRHIEAHGTGTSLGDPIEVGALVSVYGSRSGRGRDDPLSVSSVKANMGHLEAAAGMSGLFSAVLALYHGIAPPNAQLKELNNLIQTLTLREPVVFPLDAFPLKKVDDKVLIAGVSSFGYSGTIASVIVQEPPAFQRRRHDSLSFCTSAIGRRYRDKKRMHDLIQKVVFDEVYGRVVCLSYVHAGVMRRWLDDYRAFDQIILPLWAMIDMICSIGIECQFIAKGIPCCVENISNVMPLRVDHSNETSGTKIRLELESNGSCNIVSKSTESACPTTHVTAQLLSQVSSLPNDWQCLPCDLFVNETISVPIADYYSNYNSKGCFLGPSMMLIQECHKSINGDIVTAVISLGSSSFKTLYILPPPVVEAVFHSVFLAVDSDTVCIPSCIGRVWVRSDVAADEMWHHEWCRSHATIRKITSESIVFDCTLVTAAKTPVMRCEGVQLRAVTPLSLYQSNGSAAELNVSSMQRLASHSVKGNTVCPISKHCGLTSMGGQKSANLVPTTYR